jgi:hypothetical protein
MIEAWDPRTDEELEQQQLQPGDPRERADIVEVARRLDLKLDGHVDQPQTVVLASGIDASRWARAVVEVILHQRSDWLNEDNVLRVVVQSVVLHPVEPSVEYLGPTLVTVTMEGSTPAPPALLVSALPTRADRLRVTVTWQSAQVLTATAALSVRLVGRLR